MTNNHPPKSQEEIVENRKRTRYRNMLALCRYHFQGITPDAGLNGWVRTHLKKYWPHYYDLGQEQSPFLAGPLDEVGPAVSTVANQSQFVAWYPGLVAPSTTATAPPVNQDDSDTDNEEGGAGFSRSQVHGVEEQPGLESRISRPSYEDFYQDRSVSRDRRHSHGQGTNDGRTRGSDPFDYQRGPRTSDQRYRGSESSSYPRGQETSDQRFRGSDSFNHSRGPQTSHQDHPRCSSEHYESNRNEFKNTADWVLDAISSANVALGNLMHEKLDAARKLSTGIGKMMEVMDNLRGKRKREDSGDSEHGYPSSKQEPVAEAAKIKVEEIRKDNLGRSQEDKRPRKEEAEVKGPPAEAGVIKIKVEEEEGKTSAETSEGDCWLSLRPEEKRQNQRPVSSDFWS
ncbi:hypothetical protein MMC34_005543 [Xylographa carneopallida]|nr:hypothetical protein [Xylographa carneopallida]